MFTRNPGGICLLLVILPFFATMGKATFKSSEIPFNLPGQRFCRTCIVAQEHLVSSAVNFEDRICQQYVTKFVRGNIDRPAMLNDLIVDLKSRNSSITWIFYSAMSARFLYEELFQKEYSFRVTVEKGRNNSDNCVQAYLDGIGFTHSPMPKNFTAREQQNFKEGLKFEIMFVEAIVNKWTILTCNETFNAQFVKAAKKNLAAAESIARTWKKWRPMSPLLHWEPKYSNISIPFCGDSKLAPFPPPTTDSKISPCDEVFCDIESKKAKLSPNDDPSGDVPTPSCDEQSDSQTSPDLCPSDSIPRIYINEFVSFRADVSPGRSEFIELRRYPHRPKDIAYVNKHKLVAFSVISNQLLMVINLHQLQVNAHGLLVLQDTTQNYFQLPKDRVFNLLPDGKKDPIVLLLLKQNPMISTADWNRITLVGRSCRGSFSPRDLDKPSTSESMDLLSIFESTVIDGYAYGATLNSIVPEKVRKLLGVKGKSCNMILSLGDPNKPEEAQMSLNACPVRHPAPFIKEHFKLGHPTPYTPNECTTDRTYQIQAVEQPRGEDNLVGVTIEPQDDLDCPTEPDIEKPEIDELDALINYEIRYIQTNYDAHYSSKYYPIDRFRKEVWPILLENTFDPRSSGFPDIAPYEIVPNSDRTASIPFLGNQWRCSVCHKRLETCSHSMRGRSKQDQFAQKQGRQIPTATSRVQRYLIAHTSRRMHYVSVLYSIRDDRRRLDADARRREDVHQIEKLKPLANLFLTSFTIVKTNTALCGTESWYKTLRKTGADIGITLQSKFAVRTMIKFISDEGLSHIFKYLMDKDLPFTLILDGATDRAHSHYISMYFQSNEGGDTMPYFVGLIKANKTLTSEAHVEMIKNWVESKGERFYSFFIRQIVGCATDSAPTMVKMQRLINKWIKEANPFSNKVLIQTYCLAHKLNLATRSALVPLKSDKDYGPADCLKYFHVIEKFMQSTYTWISLASRRIGDFREVMVANKQPRVELKELHAERWIASEHRTVKYFLAAWITSIHTMEAVSDDATNYISSVRKDADKFNELLHDKQKLLTIVFLQDYTATFKKWSEHLQKFVGHMSDQLSNYNILLKDLQRLENLEGDVLVSLLRSCKCSSSASSTQYGCTLTEYEQSDTIEWRGMIFSRKDDDAPSLTVLAPALIQKTIKRIDFYISKDDMIALSSLCPKYFPAGEKVLIKEYAYHSTEHKVPLYAKENIEYLGNKFGMNVEALLFDWSNLFLSIMRSPNWDVLRTHRNTESFWSRALRDNELQWTDTTKRFIYTIKTISVGSTMVESGFSVFNNIKNQRRAKMNDDLLIALLNLVVNGPSDVDHFNAYSYASAWYDGGRVLPATVECVNEADEDSIIEDPLGLNEVLDEFVDAEEQPLPLNTEAEENLFQDEYDIYVEESKHKIEKSNRVRTLLM